MKEKVTDKELTDILIKFDSELDLDDDKLAKLSDKEKGELYLAVKSVLGYREDMPTDLAKAVQDLAKRAVEKSGIQESNVSESLDPDTDGVVLEDGSIVLPDDDLFPLAKQMSQMNEQQVLDWIDNVAKVVQKCCLWKMIHLMKKKLSLVEKKRIKKDGKNKDGTWPTVVNQIPG